MKFKFNLNNILRFNKLCAAGQQATVIETIVQPLQLVVRPECFSRLQRLLQALDAGDSLAARQLAAINRLGTAESRMLAKAEMLAGKLLRAQPCFRLKARQPLCPVIPATARPDFTKTQQCQTVYSLLHCYGTIDKLAH